MKRRHALLLVWTAPSLVFLAITAAVSAHYRIAPPDRLDGEARSAAIAPLRDVLADRAPAPCTVRAAGDAVAVTIWLDGRAVIRVDGHGGDVGRAIDDAVRELTATALVHQLAPDARARARIQVDVIAGRAPLAGGWIEALGVPGTAEMLAVDPGVDGVGVELAGKPVLLLPHELVAMKAVAARRPAEGMDELAVGIELSRVTAQLAARAGVRAAIAAADLFRFRSDAFVEARDAGGPPLPLVRGLPPRPAVTKAALRAAALAGGRYLVAHLAPNGRFIYEHDLVTGNRTDPARSPAYSMPRHAGTTYFLAELYRITHEPWLREPIERAIAHLAELLAAGHCATTLADGTELDCVQDRGEPNAQLGSSALAVVALAEYQRATGDARYLPLARKLAAFLLFMQRADGSFRHVYDPRTRTPDDETQQPYYSGEAALALARMHAITGEARYAAAAERALDRIIAGYDTFLGGFFYGEEHWTCIAAEAIGPAVQKAAYREFCSGYAAYSRDEQAGRDNDLAGAYDASPFLVPYNTPSGSRTEAMLSTYLMGVRGGEPDVRIARQIERTLEVLLAQQLRPDNDFAAVGDVDGGVPASAIDRTVRIDYVQHVCSAMIRASEALDW